MATDLEIRQQEALAQWMDPKALIGRLNRMKQIQKEIMKKDIHFGVIPGCKQNSLFQPGSQVLCLAFGLGHEPEGIEEFKDDDEIRYRVKDRVFDQKTGITVGFGVGECSSKEDKYNWRRVTGDKEWEATPEDYRRIKYSKDKEGNEYETKQVRTKPADVANTILKMARKRANVNGTIEALAASETFTQDVEDLPEGMELDGNGNKKQSTKPAVNPDDVKSRQPETATPINVGTITAVFKKSGNKNGKPWTKYYVIINKQSYGCFDTTLGELANSLKNQQVEYYFDIDGDYKNLKSLKKFEQPPQNPPKQPAECPESISRQSGDVPVVESSEAFASTVMLFGAQKGLDEAKIAGILQDEFQCTIDTVPADLQAKVIEHLKGL